LYNYITENGTKSKKKKKEKEKEKEKKARKYLQSAVLQARSLTYSLDELMTIFKTNTADVSI